MRKNSLLSIIISLVIFSGCTDDVTEPTLPDSYNFENVNYSGQTARLDMLAELTTEMKKANNGTQLDATTLKNMFSNTGNPFANDTLNTSGKQLKNKCYQGAGAYNAIVFEYLLDRMATISANAGNEWTPNNAGVAKSIDGTKKYFLDEYGVEYAQLIEKGLMGAVFYYRACEEYTRPDKIGNTIDNETITAGEGTAMEHHWDEAFGYFGAPIDYSSSNYESQIADGEARYHAKYAEVGQAVGLGTVDKVMQQFIKGRWGISNENYDYRDEAASQVREEWEMILATTAIHYLVSARFNYDDPALRNHALSEAYAFILSLAYNSNKKISNTDLETVKAYFETTVQGIVVPSFLNVTTGDLNDAMNQLSSVYGLDNVKESL